jgi:2-polyprenyl-6-methoxyphenol hydroxylase-like FAD-dependent oxidoreductase
MNDDKPIDVLIVGAGPAGLALAIDLARRGLDIRIIEKALSAFDGSRAKGVQPRTLEVFHDLDMLDDVLAAGSEYPKLGIHLGPLTLPWRMYPHRQPSADIPFPNTWLIPQFRTDRVLQARLRRLDRSVEFGSELLDLAQDPAMVTAKVAGADGLKEITSRYVVGADGGASSVRKMLGIGFAGSTDEDDRMIIADAVTTGLSRDRWHIWPGQRGRFTAACPLPDSDLFQWVIRLAPGEEAQLGDAHLSQQIRSRTRNEQIVLRDLQWISVLRPNIRLAGGYRHGRVFIAGDAAHVHTPFGAQGMNTGIQDGYNLGWKLAQVLAGADNQLLDSYEAERLPIAAAVLGLSTEKYNGLSNLDASSIRRGKDEQELALSYYGGPLASAHSDRTKTLRVGDRAPDATMLDAERKQVRLFDRYRGPHFTAIACGRHAAHALELLDSPSAGAQLRRVVIGATARADENLTDDAGTFRHAYGLTRDALLLIRPDGYIGHIATQDFLTTTKAALRALTPSPGNHNEGEPQSALDSVPGGRHCHNCTQKLQAEFPR